jgi:hypothetical protein
MCGVVESRFDVVESMKKYCLDVVGWSVVDVEFV